MKIELTKEQKAELEKRHRVERDGRIRDRIKAVLLFAEGWKGEEIAQALRIHPETVYEHLKDYRTQETCCVSFNLVKFLLKKIKKKP